MPKPINSSDFLKSLDFVHLHLPSTKTMSNVICNSRDQVTNRPRRTKLRSQTALKKFFFFENNCFQSHESHQLCTQIRKKSHLFFDMTLRPFIIQVISNDSKDKVKTTVENNCKKIQLNSSREYHHPHCALLCPVLLQ